MKKKRDALQVAREDQMEWDYYVLPGFIARIEHLKHSAHRNPKIEVRNRFGVWGEPENLAEMERMISHDGTLVDEAEANQTFAFFQSKMKQ